MEHLLQTLKDHDVFESEESKVGGIAQLGIDKGYDFLSVPQKRVLTSFLSMSCTGVTDPGGYHNGCTNQITSEYLAEAIEQSDDGLDGILCENCRDESNNYDHDREKFFRD